MDSLQADEVRKLWRKSEGFATRFPIRAGQSSAPSRQQKLGDLVLARATRPSFGGGTVAVVPGFEVDAFADQVGDLLHAAGEGTLVQDTTSSCLLHQVSRSAATASRCSWVP